MSSGIRGNGCRVRHLIAALICCALMAADVPAIAAQMSSAERDAMRSRIESRYEIVRLTDAIGLRPKNRSGAIRLIEIGGGSISIDGVEVSGRELRQRVGSDADLIIPLSYFDAAQRNAFLGPEESRPPAAAPVVQPGRTSPIRRHVGERVRILGDVVVDREEEVDGQVVAVLGSVRVDGHVSDQVVAVLGSIELGPEASIDGDVVCVGGSIRRATGAQIRGRITEVNMLSPAVEMHGIRWRRMPFLFGAFGAARLFGTIFRLFVLGLLASIVVLVVRQPVERIGSRVATEPVKMAVVGLLAQLLFLPALILTVIVLALSIIGIPLLLFVPFVIVALLFVGLGGFTGAAYLVGGWASDRAGWNAEQPYLRVWLGVLVVLTPLLVARLFGVVGGPFHLLAFFIAALALMFEYFVWTTGFGAALTTAFESWRTRRSAPAPPPPQK